MNTLHTYDIAIGHTYIHYVLQSIVVCGTPFTYGTAGTYAMHDTYTIRVVISKV